MSKYVMMLLACAFMFSCKSNCVEVKSNSKQVEKVQVHDTLHIKDSIYTEHKQYVHQKGDTVYIEHVIYKYKEKAQKGVDAYKAKQAAIQKQKEINTYVEEIRQQLSGKQ